MVSGASDKTIKIWDIATGEEIQTFEGHGGWVNSVAFSNDSKLVASGSNDGTIKIWEVATGKKVSDIEVFYILFRISFDTTCSYLFTDIGAIKISDGMKSYSDVEAGTHVDAQSQELQRQGYGLSTDRAWIMWNEHNVLWLPPDYRPHRMAVSPLMFAIGCHSGRLYTIGFSGPPV